MSDSNDPAAAAIPTEAFATGELVVSPPFDATDLATVIAGLSFLNLTTVAGEIRAEMSGRGDQAIAVALAKWAEKRIAPDRAPKPKPASRSRRK